MGLVVTTYIGDMDATNSVNDPKGADSRQLGDDAIRAVQGTVRRTFPNFGSPSGPVNATEAELNKLVGIEQSNKVVTLPVGTAQLFYQDSAPLGWTIANTVDDVDVRITNGTGNGGIQGGVVGGVHDYSAIFDSTLAEGATPGAADKVLDMTHIPNHNHGGGNHAHGMSIGNAAQANIAITETNFLNRTGSTGGVLGFNTAGLTNTAMINSSGTTINSEGGGLGHSHEVDIRVKYAACIIATFDA